MDVLYSSMVLASGAVWHCILLYAAYLDWYPRTCPVAMIEGRPIFGRSF